MGKPRLIIIIRHAQSEGNQNRQIHQTVPDHRVKLTPDGWDQAYDAGHRLRALLRPSDTLQFYVSPYRRTRETTQGILETLTSDAPDPSPFPRSSIKVWEEPRLREQDFGNFQPSSSAMEAMWKERANYGHFFYRIPNGESAADAYDRVSGFNESLWRSFGEEDFPSVCVLVTHGLMTRVFLMKWYHWSVEYFEDLRNVNHCEFVIMSRSPDSGKFLLQSQLRTWSELKRRAAAAERGEDPELVTSPTVPARKRWGGLAEGNSDDHTQDVDSKRVKRQSTRDRQDPGESSLKSPKKAGDDLSTLPPPLLAKPAQDLDGGSAELEEEEEDDEAFPNPDEETCDKLPGLDLRQLRSNTAEEFTERLRVAQGSRSIPNYLEAGRDFGGTGSGAATPALDTGDPYDSIGKDKDATNAKGSPLARDSAKTLNEGDKAELSEKSGMRGGARADALGDQVDVEERDGELGVPDSNMSREEIEDLEAKDKSVGGSVY